MPETVAVRFYERQEVNVGEGRTRVFDADTVYHLSPPSYRHWKDRGAVERVDESAAMKPAASRAQRATNQDDPGVDADKPDAMTTEDIKRPPADAGDDDYENMLRDELLRIAQARNIELPEGYVTKAMLVELLREA